METPPTTQKVRYKVRPNSAQTNLRFDLTSLLSTFDNALWFLDFKEFQMQSGGMSQKRQALDHLADQYQFLQELPSRTVHTFGDPPSPPRQTS